MASRTQRDHWEGINAKPETQVLVIGVWLLIAKNRHLVADNTKLKQRLRHKASKKSAPNDNSTAEPEAADAAVYESDFFVFE